MTKEIIQSHHDEIDDVEISPDLLDSSRGGSEISEIHYRMTHSQHVAGGLSMSFGEYMRLFNPLDPDVFVLTANSAIPVADAIRGWYDTTGQKIPDLTYVKADRELSVDESQLTVVQRNILETDIKRLREKYAGSRAIIIDQFVHSGKTIELASRMLGQAGIIADASTLYTKWYNHAFGEIDKDTMTSEHARFMRRIGQEAVHYSSDEYLAETSRYN